MFMHSSRRAVRAALFLAGSALAAPAFAGTVTGEVVDSTDTRALESAQVRIVELGRVATADRDGSFRFADVPAGSYTLETRYIGAEMDSRNIVVPETGDLSVEIALAAFGSEAEIIVIGQAANQASSLSRKRENDGVSDVITRDSIGQFPDQNVAESLRRVPGVNILNDQGEGRFVSVRGLDPNLNSTSLNGVRLPSPEADTRAVALDVLSSDIIESIEVKKSLTPDMEADTIGASIEIETTSAFDRKKDLLTVKLEGSYNDYADEITPKASLDFATRLGDNVGLFPQRGGRFDDRDASVFIQRVGEARIGPRAAFNQAVISEFLELSGAVGRHRHAVLTVKNFLGRAYLHRLIPSSAMSGLFSRFGSRRLN